VSTPVPTLCRLEYLTPNGWTVGHHGVNLLHPERYVERLAERGKFGRVTVLADDLTPTSTVYEPKDLPNPADLVPSETAIPRLRDPAKTCGVCGDEHAPPYDGSCLL
jgi:hypothetical protein